MKQAKKRPVLAWGGFSDGHLSYEWARNDHNLPSAAVFYTRKAARRCYDDVRRVEIREVTRVRKGKGR